MRLSSNVRWLGYCSFPQGGDWEKAWAVFLAMKQASQLGRQGPDRSRRCASCSADAAGDSAARSAHGRLPALPCRCKERRPELTSALLHVLTYLPTYLMQAGLRPSPVSYNALISACERAGQVDR